MASRIDYNLLQGWLIKKHREKKSFGFSSEARRYFKVSKVKGLSGDELILSYYTTQRSTEARGFIYLSDVKEIKYDKNTISIICPSRSLSIMTQTHAELSLWLKGLVWYCTSAHYDTIKDVPFELKSMPMTDHDAVTTDESPSPKQSVHSNDDKSVSYDDDTNSDNKNFIEPKTYLMENEAGNKSTSPLRPEDKNTTENDDFQKVKKVHDNILSGVDNNPYPNVRKEKEDHRLSSFSVRNSGGGGTTSRLHDHIRKDGNDMPSPNKKDSGISGIKKSAPPKSYTFHENNNVTDQLTADYMENIDALENVDTTVRTSSEWARLRRSNEYTEKNSTPISSYSRREMDETPVIYDQHDLSDNENEDSIDRRDDSHRKQHETITSGSGGNVKMALFRDDEAKYDSDEKNSMKHRDKEAKGDSRRKECKHNLDESGEEIDFASERKRLALLMKNRESTGSPNDSDSKASDNGRSRSNSVLSEHLSVSSRHLAFPASEKHVSPRDPDTDEDSPYDKDPQRRNKISYAAEEKCSAETRGTSEEEKARVLARFGFGQGVKADDNWLDDDFDA